jgi:hypothetical protein
MKGLNRTRALLASSAMILLCLTIIVGTTFALFSDEERFTHHLQAGDLDITLERTTLTTKSLNADGFLVDATDTTPKDFTNEESDGENVFGLADGALIVPHSTYTADMQITNNRVGVAGKTDAKSNVAFAYWVEIVFSTEAGKISGNELKDQVSITVRKNNTTVATQDAANPLGVLGVGDSEEFTVEVLFNNLENATNNLAQGQELWFDLVVHAVQYTGADPQAGTNP